MTSEKMIENTISDMVSCFLYYDRKEDENLPLEVIENMIESKEISVDDIVSKFREELIKGLNVH